MKKLLPLLLVLLLLAGCGAQEVTEPSDATESATQTQQKSLYDPNSAIEQQTGAAVQVYRLDRNDYFGIYAMGNRLLLRSDAGVLTVLQGDTGIPLASLATRIWVNQPLNTSVQGAAYYDLDAGQVVQVNPQLQETGRLTMPENMQGTPYISMSGEEIYYCVPGEIRALNMQTGVSRLIRSHGYADQVLFGTWFDGDTLLVGFIDEDNTQGAEYISTETGQTLYSHDGQLVPFYTAGDSFVLSRMDGRVHQILVGDRSGNCQVLHMPESELSSALAMGGVIGREENSLAFYEIATGRCTSRVTLEGVTEIQALLTTEDAVWILAEEGQEQILCRWDPTMTAVQEETVYTGKLYTVNDPDLEGLEACRARAAEMSQTYDVKIHVWNDVVENQDVTVTPEHQVQTVNEMLDAMAEALARFPEDFLRTTVEAGWIHINLVRSVNDDDDLAQFWQDGDCYVSIASSSDTAEALYRGIAYAIDSRVLGNSRKFDDWNDLNPEGFTYSYSYAPHPEAEAYLSREDSVFLSEKALAYPHDDRSEVFGYAMTEAGREVFQKEAAQAKLEVLCRGIREAYELEKSPEVYPWEQYLAESLAYTN